MVFVKSLRIADLFVDLSESSTSWSTVGRDFGRGLNGLSDELEAVGRSLVKSMEILNILDTTIGDAMVDFGAAVECMNSSGVKINLTELGAFRKNTMLAPTIESLRAHILSPWSVSDVESMLQVSMTTHESIGLEAQSGDSGRKLHRPQHHMQGGCGKAFECLTNSIQQRACPTNMVELNDFVDRRVDAIYELLLEMNTNLEPALTLLRRWLHTTTPQVSTFFHEFTDVLAKAQAIFDAVAAMFRPHGDESSMLRNTFNLFDVSNTGFITLEDIRQMSTLYGIPALGDDGVRGIFAQHDSNPSDGNLDKHEFRNFLRDDSLPNMMGVVLRTYATKLTAIAGPLRAAQTRSAATNCVARYLELVMLKNSTKASWICQALTNGSLPVSVTAGVLKELAVFATDPSREVLSTVDTGLAVVKLLIDFNEDYLRKSVDFLSDTANWVNEGFDPDIQADTLHQISSWMLRAGSRPPSGTVTSNASDNHAYILSQVRARVERERRQYVLRQHRSAAKDRKRIMDSKTTQALFQSSFRAYVPGLSIEPDVLQAIQSGQPATPQTLEFVGWLASNISRTSMQFLEDSIAYSSGFGQTLDLSKIVKIVDSIAAAVLTLVRYISLDGPDEIQKDIETFRRNASWEMLVSMSAVQSDPSQGIQGVLDDGAWSSAEHFFLKLRNPLPALKEALVRTSGLAASAERMIKNAFDALGNVNHSYLLHGVKYWRMFATTYFVVFLVWTLLFISVLVWNVRKINKDFLQKSMDVQYEPPGTRRECWRVVRDAVLWSISPENQHCWMSTVLLIEVVCLTIYAVVVIISLVFALVMLLSVSCSRVALLYDELVCRTYMNVISMLLVSFDVTDSNGASMCDGSNVLLLCKVINEHTAAFIFYMVFNVLQVLLILLLMVEASILLERLRLHKIFLQLKED